MPDDSVLEDLYDALDDLLFAGLEGPAGHAEAMLAVAQLSVESVIDDPIGALGLDDILPGGPPSDSSADESDSWLDNLGDSLEEAALKIAWIATHVDNMLGALVEGSASGLLGEHRVETKLREVYDTGATEDWTVTCLPPDRAYVVFSDHHFIWEGAPHDYFTHWHNREMYLQLLQHYADEGYTLVDAGDVEDLIVKPPDWGTLFADEFYDIVGLLTGGALERAHVIAERKDRYDDIRDNYQEVHHKIGSLFLSQGRFVKVAGNHDTDLRDPSIQPDFMPSYGPGTTAGMTEILLISQVDFLGLPTGDFRAFVAHGHQFDPWTNANAGPDCGEQFTESLGWFGGGADRVWTETEWRDQISELGGWENFLVKAPSMAPGNKAKIRHMGERPIYKKLNKKFDDVDEDGQPWLVLGHTHEPRHAPWTKKKSGGETWDRYHNTGAAGRYEDLIWCVEIVGGEARTVAWSYNAGAMPTRHLATPIPGKPRMRLSPPL
jgi:hypothetical protein